MAHGKSLKLRELGGVKEVLDIDPDMITIPGTEIAVAGIKKEEPKKLNRRERRARKSVITKFIRKAKKNARKSKGLTREDSAGVSAGLSE